MSMTAVLLALDGQTPASERGVMLMNRIGPSSSELFVARSDGSEERKLFTASGLDYHASYSPDGKWIVFTSERGGLGQTDIYRAHPDGADVERLTDSAALDDQGALSPDGTQLAFVSTREMHTANIWILDLPTRRLRNLTGQAQLQGDPAKPNGLFRPAWSPDGTWIAFSSDRNTEWRGHSSGAGWEYVQELSISLVRPDGMGLRRLTQPGICAGAPKWSPDGTRVVFYEIPVEQTWQAHWPGLDKTTTSQIVSVNVQSGERKEHTAGDGLKVMPQFLTNDAIGYLATHRLSNLDRRVARVADPESRGSVGAGVDHGVRQPAVLVSRRAAHRLHASPQRIQLRYLHYPAGRLGSPAAHDVAGQ
jgi:Tol biopolymer transport system component